MTVQKNDPNQLNQFRPTSPGMDPELQRELKGALAGGSVDTIIFDLIETDMLDSSGIGLMIAACNNLSKNHGAVRVVNASPDIISLLDSMRLVERLNVTGRS